MNEVEIRVTGKDDTSSSFKSANKASKDLGDGFERTGEKADKAEQRTLGLKDTIDGTAAIMQGPGKAGIGAYVQGWADLAGGLANFVIPALGAFRLSNIKATVSTVASTVAQKTAAAASKAWAAAQWVLNAALRANPILLVVTIVIALVGAIILAYKHSETFRRIVDAAGRGAMAAFRGILSVVQNVVGWIRRNWPLLLGILTGPVGLAVVLVIKNFQKIKSFVTGIPGHVLHAFQGVHNAIVQPISRAVNWALGRLQQLMSFVAGIPGRIKDAIGGALSHIPGFAHGGIVGAASGGVRGGLVKVGEHGEELVRLPYGSKVYPNGATPSGGGPGGPLVMELRVTGSSDDLLVKWLRKQIRTGVVAV